MAVFLLLLVHATSEQEHKPSKEGRLVLPGELQDGAELLKTAEGGGGQGIETHNKHQCFIALMNHNDDGSDSCAGRKGALPEDL